MFDFALSDIPRLVTLIFLEMLLSADNAVVLGVLSHSLPPHLRKKALFIGVVSSFFLRAGALLFAIQLLEYSLFQLIGAAYLLYLSIRYWIRKGKSVHPHPTRSFWKTVVLIELFDLAFALDSIIAGIAFIDAERSKLWIVYLGGMIGLLGMRYAAAVFTTLLDRFPALEQSAYLMVGWIGIKLGALYFGSPLPAPLFWSLTLLLFLLGFFRKKS